MMKQILVVTCCLLVLCDVDCQTGTFTELKSFTSSLTHPLVLGGTQKDVLMTFAEKSTIYSYSQSQKVRFEYEVVDSITNQAGNRTIFKTSSTPIGFLFLLEAGYVYKDLPEARDVASLHYFFGDYLIYKDSSLYYSFDLSTSTSNRLDPQPDLSKYKCDSAGSRYLFCFTTGTQTGILIDGKTGKKTTLDFSMELEGFKLSYDTLMSVVGYEKMIVIVGTRKVGVSLILGADLFYVLDNQTLVHTGKVISNQVVPSLICTSTTSPKRSFEFNPLTGLLFSFCSQITETNPATSPNDLTFAWLAVQNIFTLESTLPETMAVSLKSNKYLSQITMSRALTAKVFSYNQAEQNTNNNCGVYSVGFKLCLDCINEYTLEKNGTSYNCVLNEPYVDPEYFDVHFSKGFINLRLNKVKISRDELMEVLKETLNEVGDNLVFVNLATGEKLDMSQKFSLVPKIFDFDLEENLIRFEIEYKGSFEKESIGVRLKIRNQRQIFNLTSSGSTLSVLASAKPLTIGPYVYSSFDFETLSLVVYLVIVVICQVFLIFVRPFKEVYRESYKTFWIAFLVMKIQVLGLLGVVGGQNKGPLDKILSSSFVATLKYLIFDIEPDFDGRLQMYRYTSHYTDLKAVKVSPYLLHSRVLWLGFYSIVYCLSTMGGKSFRNSMYHMRLGVLFSFVIHLVYFSITSIYSFSLMDENTTFTIFSLLVSILAILFVIGETVYIFMTGYKNLKFMLAFDINRAHLDTYAYQPARFLKTFPDLIFYTLCAVLTALIPNKPEILCRGLIGVSLLYMLSLVGFLNDSAQRSFYVINIYLKIGFASLFIVLMILMVELSENNELTVSSIRGVSYFAFSIILIEFLIILATAILRIFSNEPISGTETQMENFRTGYLIKLKKKTGTELKERAKDEGRGLVGDDTFIGKKSDDLLDNLDKGGKHSRYGSRIEKGGVFSSNSEINTSKLVKLEGDLQNLPRSSSNPGSERNSNRLLDRLIFNSNISQEDKEKENKQRSTEKKSNLYQSPAKQGTNYKQGRLDQFISQQNNDSNHQGLNRNLFQIKESGIEEPSNVGDLSADINLAINHANNRSLRDLIDNATENNKENAGSTPIQILSDTQAGGAMPISSDTNYQPGYLNPAQPSNNYPLTSSNNQISQINPRQEISEFDMRIPSEANI